MAVSIAGRVSVLTLEPHEPAEPLDAARIRAAIEAARAARLTRLEVLEEVGSTNTYLLERPAPDPGRADACLAERQSAGRGRQGRRWMTPPGGGLALSLAWHFAQPSEVRPALSLATGVAVVRACERAGASGLKLKWPNDVWLAQRKVGGVLVETQGAAAGGSHVVIGIGLNVALSAPLRLEIEASGVRVAALADACPAAPDRSFLAGLLLDELLEMLLRFEQDGFAPFRPAFLALDALKDRPARLDGRERTLTGHARGVDEQGALLIDSEDGRHRVLSGEVSLRPAESAP